MRNTTLCYLERDGKYLMLHRTAKAVDENKDKWIGVGGKFEEGESPEDCLLREVREETGLTLTSWAYRAIVTFVSDEWGTEYMHLFTADAWSGTLTACSEGDLEWVDKRDVPALPLWKGDLLFFRLIDQPGPFFSLKLVYKGLNLVEAVLNGQTLPPEELP